MKVTVLRADHQVALSKRAGSGALETRRLSSQRCGVGALCVVGLLLGFVISQVVVSYAGERHAQVPDSEVQLEVALRPVEPIGVYRDTEIYQISDKYRQLRPLWESTPESNMGDSILMAAILKIARQNLMDEIENEGFIVVESSSLNNEEETDNSGRMPSIFSFLGHIMGPLRGQERHPETDVVRPPAQAVDNIAVDGDFSDSSLPFAQLFKYFVNCASPGDHGDREDIAAPAPEAATKTPPAPSVSSQRGYDSIMNNFDVASMVEMNRVTQTPTKAPDAHTESPDVSVDAIMKYLDAPDSSDTKREDESSSGALDKEEHKQEASSYQSIMDHFNVQDLVGMNKVPAGAADDSHDPSATGADLPVAGSQEKVTSKLGSEVLDWLRSLESKVSEQSGKQDTDLKYLDLSD